MSDIDESESAARSPSEEAAIRASEMLDDVTMSLRGRTRRIELVSRFIALLIAIEFLVLGIGFPILAVQRITSSTSSSVRDSQVTAYVTLTIVVVAISVLTLTALAYFESQKRVTDAYFQRLSDEMQPLVARRTKPPKVRHSLSEARFAINLYSKAGELLFAPGRYGVTFYGVVVIGVGLVSVLVSINAVGNINSLPYPY